MQLCLKKNNKSNKQKGHTDIPGIAFNKFKTAIFFVLPTEVLSIHGMRFYLVSPKTERKKNTQKDMQCHFPSRKSSSDTTEYSGSIIRVLTVRKKNRMSPPLCC